MDIQIENILAYLENRLSDDERTEFEKQLASSEILRKQLADIKFINDTTTILSQSERINVDERWQSISSRFKREKNLYFLKRIVNIAAAILIIPLLISSIYFYNRTHTLESIPVEMIEQTTAYGTTAKVILPDNSEVWLNSGSSIQYPKRFIDDNRKVSLSGEAYFKVSADKKHRFDVLLSNGLTVSAYGTEFNIDSYSEDNDIKIILAKGSVDVADVRQPIPRVLSPNEEATYNKNTNSLKVTEANVYQGTSWKDGKMVFKRSSMEEVCKRLSRHFNVDIIMQNKEIYDYTYTATFTTETLEVILSLLEKTAPISCDIIYPVNKIDNSYTKTRVLINSLKNQQ